MIYATVGTQKFEFDRMLKYIDKAIEIKLIQDKVIGQIGYCKYKPKNFKYFDFIPKEEINNIVNECEIIISHGGSGNIIENLKKQKKIIVIPRKSDLNEHIDNHQFELVKKLYEEKLILKAENEEEFMKCLKNIKKFEPRSVNCILNRGKLMNPIIKEYLEDVFK